MCAWDVMCIEFTHSAPAMEYSDHRKNHYLTVIVHVQYVFSLSVYVFLSVVCVCLYINCLQFHKQRVYGVNVSPL